MATFVQGAAVHFIDEGSGPPVLLLHGNPDSSDVWRPVIDGLRADHRCIAPDLPGFARSEPLPAPDYSLEGMAAWVEAFITAVGISGALDLVVHDIGGPLGLAWAVQHPHRVRRLAILDTAFHPDYRWHFWGRVWRTPVLGEISMAAMTRAAFRMELRRGSRHLTRQQIDETFDRMHPTMKRTVLQIYRAADPWKLAGWDRRLLQLTAQRPTLVLWGDADPYLPRSLAERFGAQRVRHFPDCGHWLQLEAAQEVGAELRAFFSAPADAGADTAAAAA